MRHLKDIIIERLVLSKNKPLQNISWEEFCEALVNYLPRKNAKAFRIFVKSTDITDDIYVNSNYRRNANGKANDKLIYITIIKDLNTNIFSHLSVAVVTDGYNKPDDDDDPDCFIVIDTFDDFKGLFGKNYIEVMREFYNAAMKRQR